MKTFNVVRIAGTLLVSATFVGCGTTLGSYRAVQDTTPSWMKYQVTGSRIKRSTNNRGQATSADFVRSTSSRDLALLPSLTIVGM